jgi:hypothetical protein
VKSILTQAQNCKSQDESRDCGLGVREAALRSGIVSCQLRSLRLGGFLGKSPTQAQMAVSNNGHAWFMLNASADLHIQIGRTPAVPAVSQALFSLLETNRPAARLFRKSLSPLTDLL